MSGTTGSIAVSAGPAVKLLISPLSSTTLVGSAASFSVTAVDNFGNIASGSSDTIGLTAPDGGATLPASVTLLQGVATFSANFASPGLQTLSASDTTTPAVRGASADVAAGQIVQGVVFQDLTGSGIYAAGDPVMPGRVVFLDLHGTGKFVAGDPTATTDAYGHFAFNGYAAGSYPVLEQTSQDTSSMVVVSQTSTLPDGSVDIGVVPISTIAPVPIVPNPFGPMTATSAGWAYIQSLYRSVLGRNAAPADVANWVQAMKNGLSTSQVAWAFINSTEHRTAEVDSYYQQFLGQGPDSGSVNWVNAMVGGMSEQQAVEGLIGSLAYQAKYASTSAYVNSLYVNVLGRQADPGGLTAWTNALTSGSMTRAEVAADFVTSTEAVDQVVESFYVNYLRRQPDAMSSDWVNYLQSPGASASVAAMGMVTSPEYLANAQALAPASSSWTPRGASRAMPAPAVLAPDWYAANLVDPAIASLVRGDIAADREITRADALNLFSAIVNAGTITAAEFQDLQTLVGNTTVVAMPAPVRNLISKTVDGSLANAYYQNQALGNLAVGSPASQLQNLVNKWFLGLDTPSTRYKYATPGGTLFGASNGAGYTQVQQGDLGDCYLLASLASLAQHDPGAIQNLISANGDGTYTVQFYAKIGGVETPDYVTVNGQLPESNGSFIFANAYNNFAASTNVLWSALVEKAYAQWNAEGFNTQVPVNERVNAYAPIGDGGNAYDVLRQLTGDPYTYTTAPATLSYAGMTAAFSAGSNVTVGTKDSPPDPSVVGNHAYAMLGYDAAAQTVILFNPWGISGAGGKPGLVALTKAQVDANCDEIDYLSSTLPG